MGQRRFDVTAGDVEKLSGRAPRSLEDADRRATLSERQPGGRFQAAPVPVSRTPVSSSAFMRRYAALPSTTNRYVAFFATTFDGNHRSQSRTAASPDRQTPDAARRNVTNPGSRHLLSRCESTTFIGFPWSAWLSCMPAEPRLREAAPDGDRWRRGPRPRRRAIAGLPRWEGGVAPVKVPPCRSRCRLRRHPYVGSADAAIPRAVAGTTTFSLPSARPPVSSRARSPAAASAPVRTARSRWSSAAPPR